LRNNFWLRKKELSIRSCHVVQQTKSNIDSTGIRKTDILSKSIIVHEKKADSTIIIGADSLKGTVKISAYPGNDSLLISHFENADLTLDLLANKKTRVVTAIAKSKPQTVHLAVDEKTTVNNDIHTLTDDRSKIQSMLKMTSDSTLKKETKQTDPSAAVSGIKTTVIWIVIALALCGVCIYFGRKMFKGYVGVN